MGTGAGRDSSAVPVTTLKDRAYRWIKGQILSCDLHPGQPLSEVALSNAVGVSRTPVREALSMLAQEGLVKVVLRRGAFVADISASDAQEILEMREALESHAAKICSEAASDEDLARMEELLRQMAVAHASGAYSSYHRLDMEFHRVMLSAAGNRRLFSTVEGLNDQMYRLRMINCSLPQRMDGSVREHEAILKALSQRDPVLAAEAVSVHIRNVKDTVLDCLRHDRRQRMARGASVGGIAKGDDIALRREKAGLDGK